MSTTLLASFSFNSSFALIYFWHNSVRFFSRILERRSSSATSDKTASLSFNSCFKSKFSPDIFTFSSMCLELTFSNSSIFKFFLWMIPFNLEISLPRHLICFRSILSLCFLQASKTAIWSFRRSFSLASFSIFFPCSSNKASLNWVADSLRAGLPSFILSMVSRNSAFSAVRRIISLACAPNIFVAAFRSPSFGCSSPEPGALVFFSYSFSKRFLRIS